MVWRTGRSRLLRKKGRIETLYTAPSEGSVVICLDEMGPLSARSYPGSRSVRAVPQTSEQPAERAKQEADYGRRGKGYVFGACRPATGDALTALYGGRTIANGSMRFWTTSTRTERRMCCCFVWRIRAGSLFSGRRMRLT